MRELRFVFVLNLRDDALRKRLAQLNAPLIEGIDVPDHALGEDGVFVQSHQLAQSFRRQLFSEDRVRWTIALEYPVGNEPLGSAFCLHLFSSLAECQCLGLRANVGNQHIVVAAKRVERLRKSDEVAGDEPGPLMNQLVERMLAVGSRLAPVNWTCVVRDSLPIEGHMLSIALHRQLLQVSWEPFQILFVGQYGHGLRTKEIAVPDRQKAHKYRQVFLEWSGAEVLVHPVETKQHGLKIVRADGGHGGEADGGGH